VKGLSEQLGQDTDTRNDSRLLMLSRAHRQFIAQPIANIIISVVGVIMSRKPDTLEN